MKGIQDSVTATLSAEGVPVNEKLKLLEDELNELNDTVDDLHGIIKTSEELNLYIGRLQVYILTYFCAVLTTTDQFSTSVNILDTN